MHFSHNKVLLFFVCFTLFMSRLCLCEWVFLCIYHTREPVQFILECSSCLHIYNDCHFNPKAPNLWEKIGNSLNLQLINSLISRTRCFLLNCTSFWIEILFNWVNYETAAINLLTCKVQYMSQQTRAGSLQCTCTAPCKSSYTPRPLSCVDATTTNIKLLNWDFMW